MAEFAILAVLLYIWLERWQTARLRRYWTASALAAFYACTDEFHQLLVPGRAGRVSDVLIDCTGVVLGLAFFILLQDAVMRMHRRRNPESGREGKR